MDLKTGMFLVWGLFASQPALAQEAIPSAPVPVVASPAPASPMNFQLVVSEEFLNRLMSRQETHADNVRDQFQDVPITGRQETTTRLGIDLEPSPTEGRWRMVLSGDTASTTSGFTPQSVVVHSVGQQHFRATKDVLFDGYQFTTRHAVLSVQAENCNVGATTQFSGRPLGPLMEQIVLQVAQTRQPAAQAFARDRVIKRVYPRFDGDVDAQLARGNQMLKETLQARLTAAQLMPKRVSVQTTETQLRLAAAMAVPAELSDVPPPPEDLATGHGAVFYLHESLLQGIADRSKLAGTTMTNRELISLLRLVGLTAELPDLGALTDVDVDIHFVDVNPLVIDVGDDETRLTLRAAFNPPHHHIFPRFEVTIPYRLVNQEDKWLLKAGSVEARKLHRDTDEETFVEHAVKKLIETTLPSVSFPQQLPTTIWPKGKTPPKITSIRSRQGWLVIAID